MLFLQRLLLQMKVLQRSDMQITSLEKCGKGRYKVILDGASAPSFMLYASELKELSLSEGTELAVEKLDYMFKEVLVKRGLKRAAHLLEKKDYTEREIRSKLREGLYPDISVDIIINRLVSYGFINDISYAVRYAECYIDKKSAGRISEDLKRKGIDRDIIKGALEKIKAEHAGTDGYYDESDKIKKLLEKRHYEPETADRKEKEKLRAFLLRRGFCFSDIKKFV